MNVTATNKSTLCNMNVKEKEIKRQTLLELVDYVATANGKFSESVIQEAVRMVSVNIFRTLNPQPRENKVIDALDLEEEEPSMDPSWPHLQLVYELLLRFYCFPLTPRLSWLRSTLTSLSSRGCLICLIQRILEKETVSKRFVFETEKHNGIAEFLEILGSIINGFALPLKEEHKVFLVRALIPLHKPKCLQMYHQQLSYCITQFVEKDCKLADTVIRGLLKSWPVTNSSKEVMFLNELEEVLEATQPPEFQRCMVPLFRRVARCLNSLHFQVAERALFLWNNDHIENLIKQNCKKIFNDNDPEFFKECLAKFREVKSKEAEVEAKRQATWKRLEEIGMQKQKSSSS
ncbi:hypothetical protein HID58_021436 [Brassica napus]|uniref:Serine/threonine protein phosphatase 2A regulatory subunit n=1 Tax=Brassica napus TaxID=3708 RepID=A0ABQ8CWE7_BRANA|nr:hypothetical protein HID58_021436 [Brassica napus]